MATAAEVGPDTLTDVPGIRAGHAEVPDGGSGCTVLLGPFRGAAELRGGGTGTREFATLDPFHLVPEVDALLFTGGSAFGLAAADGVMAWLEEKGMGYDTGRARVPIVPAAVLFDLGEGRARPGPAEGRAACEAAGTGPLAEGRVGAGAGATTAGILGDEGRQPGGIGSASTEAGDWRVGALAAVNALGVVREGSEWEEGSLPGGLPPGEAGFGRTRTTLAAVVTDAPLGARGLVQLLRIAATALPRRIDPVHTPFDGDVVAVLSTAREPGGAELDAAGVVRLGILAREALERSIVRAVRPRPELEGDGARGRGAS